MNKSRSIFTVISIVSKIFNNYLSVEETENQCHNGALQKKKSNSLKSHCLICHISMTWVENSDSKGKQKNACDDQCLVTL